MATWDQIITWQRQPQFLQPYKLLTSNKLNWNLCFYLRKRNLIFTCITGKATRKNSTTQRINTHLFPSFPEQREKTITSAPSLMVLVLKPFPSDKSNIEQVTIPYLEKKHKTNIYIYMYYSITTGLHCPIVFASLLFAEYPKDMHCRILSGSIPPPLSAIELN